MKKTARLAGRAMRLKIDSIIENGLKDVSDEHEKKLLRERIMGSKITMVCGGEVTVFK